MSQTDEIIDIKPHPRLLTVLGDIEFAPWQCLAELIDNAFDDFLACPLPDGEKPTVGISLPGKGSTHRSAQVWVRDNGRGMALRHLNSALRAGWTNNPRYGQLGLFGMGFNIATARLGTHTTIRTTRAGDPEWISVTLDLQKLAAAEDFHVPVLREPKSDPSERGTEVIISGLKPEQHDALVRQRHKIRQHLGDVYSYLLRERAFRIVVDNTQVAPRRPCAWDESRYVVRQGGRIPAVMRIDERLKDRAACLSCGRWQDATVTECEECDSPNVEVRERRIHGWVGVQRYLHVSDYGIDFLRNGRKILIRDTRLFAWEDPNEPGARPEQEYPIELAATVGGRLVGEIHCDFVPVNYQKTAFEYDTPDWRAVVRLLRGDSPLRPQIARDRGYTTVNESPLAKLLAGYRRNDPGLKYLVPGDGRGNIHERTREWAKLFHQGDPAYQTDERWYEAARLHDNPPVVIPPEATTPPDGGGADVLERLGLSQPQGEAVQPAPAVPPQQDTEDERRARYREHGERLPDLAAEYGLPGFGQPLNVTAWSVTGIAVLDHSGERVPALVARGRGSAVEVFVDADHPLFTDFAMDPRDVAVIELAEHLRIRASSDKPLSTVIAELKQRCLPDHQVSPPVLAARAVALLVQVRELMQPVIAGNSEGFWGHVTEDERAAAERRFAAEGGDADWNEAREEGWWIHHVPPSALVRLVQSRAGDFLDGQVFRQGYAAYQNPHARAVGVNRVIGYLNDVGLLAEHLRRRPVEELTRGRLSCLLLERELVTEPESAIVGG